MSEIEVCPTRLIEDTPAWEDLLSPEGSVGPHSRLAEAIAHLIHSPNEPGGKMIGLEGSWGTGKSTVVNLLQKSLEGKGEITTFSFDAWAHEGDPLRRTFLESLIKHFQSLKDWIDFQEWEDELDKLSKRRRTTTNRTIPGTTKFGGFFAFSIILMAVGTPFLSYSLPRVTIDADLPLLLPFVLGFPATISPIIILLGNVFRVWFKKGFSGIWDTENWVFLSGQVITDTTQDTTESPAPTSIEF